MKLTHEELCNLFKMETRTGYRWADRLKLPYKIVKKHRIYDIPPDHKFIKSFNLLTGRNRMIYSITDLSKVWARKGRTYTRERVRQLIHKYKIPTTGTKKLMIWLCDLTDSLEK